MYTMMCMHVMRIVTMYMYVHANKCMCMYLRTREMGDCLHVYNDVHACLWKEGLLHVRICTY